MLSEVALSRVTPEAQTFLAIFRLQNVCGLSLHWPDTEVRGVDAAPRSYSSGCLHGNARSGAGLCIRAAAPVSIAIDCCRDPDWTGQGKCSRCCSLWSFALASCQGLDLVAQFPAVCFSSRRDIVEWGATGRAEAGRRGRTCRRWEARYGQLAAWLDWRAKLTAGHLVTECKE